MWKKGGTRKEGGGDKRVAKNERRGKGCVEINKQKYREGKEEWMKERGREVGR